MALLVALFAFAAMVWMVPVFRSGRMLPLVSAVLLLGTVLGTEFFSVDGPFQISLDRIAWLLVMGLTVVRWRLGDLQSIRLTRADWLLLAMVGWLLLSTARGGPIPESEVPPVARWLFYVAMPVSLYFVCRFIKLRSADIRVFGRVFLALATYLAFTAICEVRGWDAFVFPRYIMDRDHWEFLGRGRGPLLNPAANGCLMLIGLMSAVGLIVRGSRVERFVSVVTAVVILGGLYSTLTRSIWLSVLIALAIAAMVYTPRWVQVLGLVTAMVLGGLMAAGLKDQILSFKRDKNLSASDAAKSVQLRPLLAVVAWEMFQDRPITGHGFGHYFAESPPYHTDRGYGLPLEQARPYMQHNVLLSLAVDSGLLGVLPMMLWFAIVCRSTWLTLRESSKPRELSKSNESSGPYEATQMALMSLGILAGYVTNGMFHDVIVIPMMHMFLFSFAGLQINVRQHGLEANATMQAATLPARAGNLSRLQEC
ncbi:MAG: O-antigen ligase family protein [Planctomycetota bacterium]